MDQLFLSAFLKVALFLVGIVQFADEGVEVVSLPVLIGGLRSLDLLISFQLVLMELKVPACDDVIVSQTSSCHLLDLLLFLFWGRGSLFWCGIMMLLKRNIAEDVIVGIRLSAASEIPGLLFGVIRTVFQALKFVFKVDNVESLLVPQ